MRFFVILVSLIGSVQLIAQDVLSQFNVAANACRNEILDIENLSENASFYKWDFCVENMEESPVENTIVSVSGINANRGFDLVEQNGDWYAFATDRSTNALLRLYYGSDPSSTPSITNFGDLSTLSGPEGLSVIRSGDGWHVFIGYSLLNTDAIIRVDFGSSLANDPVSVNEVQITGFTGQGRIWDLKAIEEDGNFYLVFPFYNRNELVVLDYRDSYLNTIDPIHIQATNIDAGSLRLFRGIDLINHNDTWYAFVMAQIGDDMVTVEIGNDLFDTPTVIGDYDLVSIESPYRISLLQSGDQYFALVSNQSIEPSILNISQVFASSLISEVSNSGIALYNGFDIIDFEGDFFVHGIVLGSLVQTEFSNDCSASEFTSNEFRPTVSYSEEGQYSIELRAFDSDSIFSISSEIINLSIDIAPSISYFSEEICIADPINFSPSNANFSVYNWDFDGDGFVDLSDATGSDQAFDYTIAGGGPGPGTYTVRLDVNDGTCNNFYEETITIYPEPPVPAFTVSNSECVNTDISFMNDTDESQHTGVISYMWDFDSDGTIDSTDPNPTFAYTTPGIKTVTLYDTIPGCRNTSATFDITIAPGPTSDFTQTSNSACEGETITFFDSSTGAVDYLWDFQNGFTSTLANPPAQLFENSGFYDVSLTTTDAQGCQSTFTREISISSSPEIAIDFDIPCTSPDGVQFTDLTTVDDSDIVSWSWEVDGEEVSTQQNPIINFATTGIKTIGLTVVSGNGCEQFATEDIEVLTAPTADFSINLGCQGEASMFEDASISTGNPIISWLWTVDGVNYGTQDISHVFTDAGSYEVMLEVTGQNFCSEAITQTVEVIELPQVAFTVNGECDNQVIRAIDQSIDSADPVVSRRWSLNGVNVGSGTQLFLNDLEDNSYDLELELETESGCFTRLSQTLEINDAPESSFTSSRTYGVPNDRLTFTNSSSGGVSYQWLLDDVVRSTDSGSESITFIEPGTYEVSLVSQNSLGCYDTARQDILIAIPEIDLSIGSFELVNENTTGRIFLEVQNFSNLPVEITEAQITLENQFSVSEQILEFVDVGASQIVSLNVGIPLQVSEPSYFCVNLVSQYVDYEDINPVNNEKCLTIQPQIQVENPFPNPVSNQFRLKIITPSEAAANLQIINSAGKIQRDQNYQAIEGLNNFFVDMSTFDPGIYYVTVTVLGRTFKRKVIKL